MSHMDPRESGLDISWPAWSWEAVAHGTQFLPILMVEIHLALYNFQQFSAVTGGLCGAIG